MAAGSLHSLPSAPFFSHSSQPSFLEQTVKSIDRTLGRPHSRRNASNWSSISVCRLSRQRQPTCCNHSQLTTSALLRKEPSPESFPNCHRMWSFCCVFCEGSEELWTRCCSLLLATQSCLSFLTSKTKGVRRKFILKAAVTI